MKQWRLLLGKLRNTHKEKRKYNHSHAVLSSCVRERILCADENVTANTAYSKVWARCGIWASNFYEAMCGRVTTGQKDVGSWYDSSVWAISSRNGRKQGVPTATQFKVQIHFSSSFHSPDFNKMAKTDLTIRPGNREDGEQVKHSFFSLIIRTAFSFWTTSVLLKKHFRYTVNQKKVRRRTSV